MAILMAFQTPELEILGLTTVFGNVSTQDATRNALLLVCTVQCISLLCHYNFWNASVISFSLFILQKNSVRLLASLMFPLQKEVPNL
jgi:hypothetical protein